MPYAAKATIQHEYIAAGTKIWVTFRHPMKQTVTPPLALWLIEADTVTIAAVAQTWIDPWTLLITSDTIATRPTQLTLAYDGPNENLITAWWKQWEPWGPILSQDLTATLWITGMIILWSGSVVSIPSGWQLCNGSNGSPDLRDKFVIGAGNTYNPNDTGGSDTHNHTATQAGHNHNIPGGMIIALGANMASTTDSKTPAITVANKTTLPPYYALCYIMKL